MRGIQGQGSIPSLLSQLLLYSLCSCPLQNPVSLSTMSSIRLCLSPGGYSRFVQCWESLCLWKQVLTLRTNTSVQSRPPPCCHLAPCVPKQMAQLLPWHEVNPEAAELKGSSWLQRRCASAERLSKQRWHHSSALRVLRVLLLLHPELDKPCTEEAEELKENKKGWCLPGASLASKAFGMSSFFAPSSMFQQKDSRSLHIISHANKKSS